MLDCFCPDLMVELELSIFFILIIRGVSPSTARELCVSAGLNTYNSAFSARTRSRPSSNWTMPPTCSNSSSTCNDSYRCEKVTWPNQSRFRAGSTWTYLCIYQHTTEGLKGFNLWLWDLVCFENWAAGDKRETLFQLNTTTVPAFLHQHVAGASYVEQI